MVKVKVNFSLEQTTKAQRSSRCITVPFLSPRRQIGVGGHLHAPAVFTPEKDPAPIVQEAGWVSEPVWKEAENFAFTRIRTPDCPARSESLYRLSYRGPQIYTNQNKIFHVRVKRKWSPSPTTNRRIEAAKYKNIEECYMKIPKSVVISELKEQSLKWWQR